MLKPSAPSNVQEVLQQAYTPGFGTQNVYDQEDKNVTSENKGKLIEGFKKCWDTFHRYFVYVIIAILLGVYIGVSVSRIYYANKIQENIQIGGMVYKEKIYSIIPK